MRLRRGKFKGVLLEEEVQNGGKKEWGDEDMADEEEIDEATDREESCEEEAYDERADGEGELTNHDADMISGQLKEAIQDIYQIMVQTNSYGTTSRPSNQVLEANVKQLSSSLQKIHHSVAPSMPSSRSLNLPAIPPELIQYVDAGRNPDIYTRELVEATRKSNQIMKGKMEAFGMFRNTLAAVMKDTMPELDVDVVNMVEKTGGKMEDVEKIRENINGKNI